MICSLLLPVLAAPHFMAGKLQHASLASFIQVSSGYEACLLSCSCVWPCLLLGIMGDALGTRQASWGSELGLWQLLVPFPRHTCTVV